MLRIAGIQKTSLIDYPGRIVSTLFTQGCNLNCPYCHNPDLVPLETNTGLFPPEKLLDFFARRKNLLDGVCITGGEPTIQAELPGFISEVKSLDLVVKLDTNGTNPEVIKDLLAEDLLDYLAVDIKAPLEKYQQVTGKKGSGEMVRKTISLLKESDLQYEFRTTIVPGLHQVEDMQSLGELLQGTGVYYLQNFRPLRTLDPVYQEVTPFPPAKLAEFEKAISPYVQQVKLRE